MINDVIKIFKNFINKHKIFTSISLFISLRFFVLYFIISIIIFMKKYDTIEISDMGIFGIPVFYEIMIRLSFYDASNIIDIDVNILQSLCYAIVLFMAGKNFLKKEIDNIAEKENFIDYKSNCYATLFSVYFILNYVNLLFFDYASR